MFAAAWCCWFAAAFAGNSAEGGARFRVDVWRTGIGLLPQGEV
ncbi:MAG: hypothetical protein JWQ04_2627, partial [Pedosphaera sp.]|nr:hypothetical protein [Pedosphaera sp.]